ncbi:MAG TPA: O-antigen ligase family protein [Gaiellaceae bacterium]|nr:O-antigen ligase family protein [Gaiellaceae bacterium]
MLVVGLVLHNAAMAQLWELGVRGTMLDAVAAWKEALLLVALLVVAWKVRRLPAVTAADVLAGSYTAVIVLYWLIPQDVLGGDATARGELLALRHHLFPVAAYALGRLVGLAWEERGRVSGLVILSAVVVALVGLLDLAFVSLQAWRDSGVPGWFAEQLGLDYEGLSGLPENWVYNTGDENNPLRRLVSTFLSPLASAYALVVALIYVVSRPLRWWWAVLAAVLFVALLYTHTRAAFGALVFGLVLLAMLQRRLAPAAVAGLFAVVSAAFLVAYPMIGPTTSYTPTELEELRANAIVEGGTGRGRIQAIDDESTESHWTNLRDGIRVVLEHPQGRGLGNAGVVAKRTGVEILAGESTYTELGVDAGIAGVAAFVLWSVAVLLGLWRREAWLAAAFAAVLALGLQTDVIGIHWLAFTVWFAVGVALGGPREAPDPSEIYAGNEPGSETALS